MVKIDLCIKYNTTLFVTAVYLHCIDCVVCAYCRNQLNNQTIFQAV